MAARTVEVTIRCTDLEPVKQILAAAKDLADAVEVHLSPYTPESLVGTEATMSSELRAFRATVLAQARASDGC